MQRTHTCGELTEKNIGEVVTLCGWVYTRRDHGGLIFVDLWDKTGLTQVVLNPQIDKLAHQEAQSLRGNFVIAVQGNVRARPEDMVNLKLKTGAIEVYIDELEILNPSSTPPFSCWGTKRLGRPCGSNTATSICAAQNYRGTSSCVTKLRAPSATCCTKKDSSR